MQNKEQQNVKYIDVSSIISSTKHSNSSDNQVIASTKDGFLQLANALARTLCLVQLSDRESRLFNAVMFKTYGFNKPVDWIANIQLTELTGIDKTHISTVKKSLLERNILFKEGRKIGINPVVSDWVMSKKHTEKPVQDHSKSSLDGLAKKPNQVSRLPKLAKKVAPMGNHNKQDNKTINTNTINSVSANKFSSQNLSFDYLPDDISIETAAAFIEHRLLLKVPLTQRAFNLAMEEASSAPSIGLTPNQAIDETIAAGWKGIKIAWLENRIQGTSATNKNITALDNLGINDTSWADNLRL